MSKDGQNQERPSETCSIRSNDVLEHGRQLRGWRLECVQLSAGAFDGITCELQLDHFQIIRERTNQALIKRGASWPDSIVLSLPLDASGQGWLGGHQLPAGATLLSDGNNLPELRTPTRLDLICVAFSRRWFTIRVIEAGYLRLAEHVWRLERFSIPEQHRLALCALLLSIFEEVERQPSILVHAASREALEDTLLETLLAGLAESVLVTLAEDTPRKQLADQVRYLMLKDPSEAPNLAEICRRLSISRAHLQNCFQLSYGVTATQMIRAARLHGVRSELRDARLSGRQVSIGDVAARWGFWHWSRFTADYRRQFGELPSVTVRPARLSQSRQFKGGRSDSG
ncbi:helix-turn-helix domain-containing protein [Rhizobium sp. RU36D]|uniref:helix-turn-helix domain-containing protein n=1 Tax=Rhizobium sp. RU36D TaxID=1907415 RepID=UPI0009D895D7|nr:helix-turn-helix domain-containing protein [Rhizobium sp. RU36D]SMC72033.1 AraC family transcriptional regulator, ethanolamine operon transcriptional activator [Rhizobium sp. RU36D]